MAQTIERFAVTGRVQGVFYRKWARNTAEGLGLRGFVRNISDGSVEAVLAGSPEQLDAFGEAARAGPPDASVQRVDRTPAVEADLPGGYGVVIADDG